MNILFACNSQYVMPLAVCITSIFENHKTDTVIHVYVLSNDLDAAQKEILSKIAQKYNHHIYCIDIDHSYFSEAPVLRWTKETYYRLLINEVLPQDLDRLLYLDCDIVVNKSLSELYDSNLEDYYISAREILSDIPLRENIDLAPAGKYFQAGVILFDLRKARTILDYKKACEVIAKLGDKIQIVDQDVLNVIFDGKIKPLDKIYNNHEITNFNGSIIDRILNRIDSEDSQKTAIFHYARGKPWNNLYAGSCEHFWYKYLQLSPYNSLYTEKFNTIKYKILRTGIVKTIFFTYIHITPIINGLTKRVLSKEKYIALKDFYRRHIK